MTDGMDELQRRANVAMQEGLERSWAREKELATLRSANERLRAALEELYWAVDNACTGGALNLTAFKHQRNLARATLAQEKQDV